MFKYLEMVNIRYGLEKKDLKGILKYSYSNSKIVVISFDTKERGEYLFVYENDSLENRLFITKNYDIVEDYILKEYGITKLTKENDTLCCEIIDYSKRKEEIIYNINYLDFFTVVELLEDEGFKEMNIYSIQGKGARHYITDNKDLKVARKLLFSKTEIVEVTVRALHNHHYVRLSYDIAYYEHLKTWKFKGQ